MCGGLRVKVVGTGFVLVALGCHSGEQPAAIPHLEIAPRAVDLGSVSAEAGATLRARARLSNRGRGTLRIFSLSPSCGCTVVQPPPPLLSPGQSELVQITVRNTYEPGPRSSVVTFRSNDPNSPATELAVRWKVVPVIAAEPGDLDFGVLRGSESRTRNVSVHVVAAYAHSAIRVEGSIPGVQWSWADGRLKETRTLTVGVKAAGAEGEHAGSLVLANEARTFRMLLPIRWQIRPLIRVSPGAIISSAVNQAEMIDAEFLVSGDSDFGIKQIEMTPSLDECSSDAQPLDHSGKKDRYKVKVRARAPREKGPHRLIIRLLTDIPESETISVPWCMFVE